MDDDQLCNKPKNIRHYVWPAGTFENMFWPGGILDGHCVLVEAVSPLWRKISLVGLILLSTRVDRSERGCGIGEFSQRTDIPSQL